MNSQGRAEVLSKATLARLESDIRAALRRRTAAEPKLAGALRALAVLSPAVRSRQAELGHVLLRRGSFERELYAGAARSLAETGDERAAPLLSAALATESAGGLATLSAAGFCRAPELGAPLARVAGSRHAHLAFAAEVARMARGESDGSHLFALAPKIKESHRIALCVELFVPLARGAPLCPGIGPPLAVLRDSERHLGRWLVLAEVACRAGDPRPLEEARERASSGAVSSRAAWSLVAWSLSPGAAAPPTRPTVELVARLSDRPSADRDMTFLFRLALARAPTARPMLEGLAKATPLSDEVAVRAAMHLVRDHGKSELLPCVAEVARSAKREDLRGVASAALWDVGDRERAKGLAEELSSARAVSAVAWGALVCAAGRGRADGLLLSEPTFRRVEYGWVE
jgi:hypothetical protein